MAGGTLYGQEYHLVPLVAPQQLSATTTTGGINGGLFSHVQFVIALGDLATADFTLTVACSAVTALSSATAIAFNYRVSAAAGTDTMGAVTASESTGLALTNTSYDNKTVVVDVDASELTAAKPYVGVVLTRAGSATAYASITAICKPRYPDATPSAALT